MRKYKACTRCINTWEGKEDICPVCGKKYTHLGFTDIDNATKEDLDKACRKYKGERNKIWKKRRLRISLKRCPPMSGLLMIY